MLINDILKKVRFDNTSDRIGPDLPFTHWKLYFKRTMKKMCLKKFHRFGSDAEFRPGAYAIGCSNISIGNRVVIRPGCMFFAEAKSDTPTIIIEDNVMLGSGVHIYIHNHSFNRKDIALIDQGYSPYKSVILKNGCWLGANVVVLPGVTVGRNSVVGAGSIITKSIPDYVVAAGNPAKVIKNIY